MEKVALDSVRIASGNAGRDPGFALRATTRHSGPSPSCGEVKGNKRLKLQCFLAFFVGANANGFLDVENEDFAIADLAGFGRFRNGVDCL